MLRLDIFCRLWYKIVMLQPKVYTPEQVAAMLQLSKNTIYDLICRGEIVAKRIGKVYRVPAASLSFVFSGLDDDLYRAQETDRKKLPLIQQTLSKTRTKL